jgi:hypothetical protein
MKIASSIALLASLAATAAAFTPAATSSSSSSVALSATRRESIEQLFGTTASALSAGVLLTATTTSQPANAVSAEEAEYNELINVLKARSDQNSEANKNYAMRSDKLSQRDFDDVKTRRPKLIIVSTTKGNKILTKEEFNTFKEDGKIDVIYGTRMKQGGGEMKDYNDITYVLKD